MLQEAISGGRDDFDQPMSESEVDPLDPGEQEVDSLEEYDPMDSEDEEDDPSEPDPDEYREG